MLPGFPVCTLGKIYYNVNIFHFYLIYFQLPWIVILFCFSSSTESCLPSLKEWLLYWTSICSRTGKNFNFLLGLKALSYLFNLVLNFCTHLITYNISYITHSDLKYYHIIKTSNDFFPYSSILGQQQWLPSLFVILVKEEMVLYTTTSTQKSFKVFCSLLLEGSSERIWFSPSLLVFLAVWPGLSGSQQQTGVGTRSCGDSSGLHRGRAQLQPGAPGQIQLLGSRHIPGDGHRLGVWLRLMGIWWGCSWSWAMYLIASQHFSWNN